MNDVMRQRDPELGHARDLLVRLAAAVDRREHRVLHREAHAFLAQLNPEAVKADTGPLTACGATPCAPFMVCRHCTRAWRIGEASPCTRFSTPTTRESS